jgi:hypothetical protein
MIQKTTKTSNVDPDEDDEEGEDDEWEQPV